MTHSARKEASRTEGVCAPGECFRPDGFTILDATAFVRIAGGLTLRAGVFNILDETYAWWSDVRGLASTSTVTDAYTQPGRNVSRSEEHTSELQSLMRISYAVFCLKKKRTTTRKQEQN